MYSTSDAAICRTSDGLHCDFGAVGCGVEDVCDVLFGFRVPVWALFLLLLHLVSGGVSSGLLGWISSQGSLLLRRGSFGLETAGVPLDDFKWFRYFRAFLVVLVVDI
ncbi:hypothetical protein OUZ56_026623 [Daphnia magna]|uniref:Uncharacterized protein n=1 Tax=Daphnia magna TaxID=35525 RepID=A0ABQ9ZMA6_9CRUS|nr:hypothetical protein OUZ56_026623 [Daphnia magna]